MDSGPERSNGDSAHFGRGLALPVLEVSIRKTNVRSSATGGGALAEEAEEEEGKKEAISDLGETPSLDLSESHPQVIEKANGSHVEYANVAEGLEGNAHHGERSTGPPSESSSMRLIRGISKFCTANFLLLSILVGVVFGFLFPTPGVYANKQLGLSRYCTFAIFVTSGLVLDTRELQQVSSSIWTFAFGVLSILFLTPFAALLILRLPLYPLDLRTGLALFACMPCTITGGVSLVRAAGANTAVALGLTVLTNTSGILTIPLVLTALVQGGSGLSLPAGPLLRGLTITLLVPLIFGMVLRRFVSGVAEAVDRRRQPLGLFNNFLLSLIPWMQISCSKTALQQLSLLNLVPVAISGIALHCFYLLFNSAATRVMRGSAVVDEDAVGVDRAVVILASQKSLATAATVVGNLGGALGTPGLLLLPCIMSHFLQIIVDTLLVSKWLKDDQELLSRKLKTT